MKIVLMLILTIKEIKKKIFLNLAFLKINFSLFQSYQIIFLLSGIFLEILFELVFDHREYLYGKGEEEGEGTLNYFVFSIHHWLVFSYSFYKQDYLSYSSSFFFNHHFMICYLKKSHYISPKSLENSKNNF